MRTNKYKVDYNHCDCHPETCCCRTYALYKDGAKIKTDDDKDYLERSAAIKEQQDIKCKALETENAELKSRVMILREKLDNKKASD